MKSAAYRKHNDRTHNSSTYHKKDGTTIRAIIGREAEAEIAEATAQMDTTTNQQATEAAYQAAHVEAACLTDRILDMLHDLPAPGNDRQPVDWSHVGSLNEVNRRLRAVVAFLQNTEE